MSDIRAIAAPSTNLKIERLAACARGIEGRRAPCRHAGSEILTIEDETRMLLAGDGIRLIRARRVVTRERS